MTKQDNYSWLDDSLSEHGVYPKDERFAESFKQTIISQIEIEKLRAIEDYITWGYGKRCKTKDLKDFPELKDNERCACCEEWEHFDDYKADLQQKLKELE